MHLLSHQLSFPPPQDACDDGLLAIGGDLTPQRLLLAYRSGIFPWFNSEDPICWWSPDPRFVLLPGQLYVSSSMKQLIKKNHYQFSVNKDFAGVICHCKTMYRREQAGTWITDEMENAYLQLHQMGYAHSAEAWQNEKLVGGLYGIRLGNVFFGESMFTKQSNASKFAFIKYVDLLRNAGVTLIDCQVYTAHLESLGARMISRSQFLQLLQNNL